MKKILENKETENENGRSMIEMLGVLAIIGVLSVGGIACFSKAMQRYRINKAIEQITQIAGNIRTFFATQKSYLGVDCSAEDGTCSLSNGCGSSIINSHGVVISTEQGCPVIKKAKIFPDDMITVNEQGKITSITNPFGYGVILQMSYKAQRDDNQAFQIIYSIGIDNEEACIELSSHDWSAANVGLIGFSANGPSSPTGKHYFTPPIDINTAIERCSVFVSYAKSYSSAVKLQFLFDVDVGSTYWQSVINPS